jgi:protein-tyrosine phosphatase
VIADVIGPGVLDRPRTGPAAAQDRDARMRQVNRSFVSADQSRAAYALLLREVADEGAADLYHCTAGKDRTGWASAVLLTILGVPRETVMADYLASNAYLAGSSRERVLTGAGVDASKLMLSVNASWLEAAFAEVDEKYGSFDAYVRQGLGLTDADVAALKARYLVGAAG